MTALSVGVYHDSNPNQLYLYLDFYTQILFSFDGYLRLSCLIISFD